MDDQSPPPPRESRSFDLLWFLAFGLLATAYCITAAQKLGATFDEPFYVQAGMERWRTGSYHQLLRAGTMPLPVDVQTLPLYLYETFNNITLNTDGDLDRLLPYARLGTLFFLWLLLIYARLIGRAIAGPWAGRLAVAFIALEPSFLGHASLATTDISVTACLLPLLYHYWKNREAQRWIWRIGLPSVCFGFALLAKASALLFGPVCLLVIECHRLAGQGAFRSEQPGLWARLRQVRAALYPWYRQMWAIGLLGVATCFVYCGSDWRAESSFVAWANKLPEGTARNVMLPVAENLCIFPNAGNGLMRQVRHNIQGHAVYLLGFEHYRAIWFYFPILITIKLTLPLLALTLLAAVLKPRALLNWAFLCFLALFALSLTYRVQIGIRMVLPMVALWMIGLSCALAEAVNAFASRSQALPGNALPPGSGWRNAILTSAAFVGLAWTLIATSREHPHGLCYINELWGGTQGGYVHVSDANYDWGQGLKELRRWQQRNNVRDLAVWYFGTDPLLKELPVESIPVTRWMVKSEAEFLDEVRGKVLAVSTTNVYGSYARETRVSQEALRKIPPTARTQTFLIYDFRGEPFARRERP